MENTHHIATKVVIADDDLEVQELLKFTLEAEKFTVFAAQNGDEALRMVRDIHPDLVILDVNMPRMTGFEVCEKIREDGNTALIPVVILTSLNKAKDRITGIKLGADEYLSKPFEPLELVARVENLLRRTRESLSANPLTGLPGNFTLEKEIRSILDSGRAFTMMYADIDNFKSYNDKYGFDKGDGVIRLLSALLKSAVAESGNRGDFICHIGGEDFVILTTPEKVDEIAESVIHNFDTLIPNQYDADARANGGLAGTDRDGKEVKYPLLTISLGVVNVLPGKYQHYSQIVDKAKEMLKLAKSKPYSTCVIA